MPQPHAAQRAESPLRRDVRMANLNAALWALGAGLAPTLLVTYLALDLGAKGWALSGVLAAPRLAGLLRLFVPSVINRLGSRKPVCLGSYAASGIVLLALPVLARPGALGPASVSLAVLLVLWGLYQVLEYFGTTALWSWLGDLLPQRLRGRLIGQRERWLVCGQIAGMALGFAITSQWKTWFPDAPRWLPLAASASVGAVMMVVAIVPLAVMRSAPAVSRHQQLTPWTAMLRATSDPCFARLILWSMALAVANGIAAAARGIFPYRVLDWDYPQVLQLTVGMRVGQALAAPWAGLWVDRGGSRRMMLLSQAVVSTSPLFFLLASRDAPWWLAGAFIAWVAYAGLNVGLDSLKLTLAPPGNNAPALSIYYAACDLTSGVTILLGGLLLDRVIMAGPAIDASYRAPLVLEFGLRTAVCLAVLLLPTARGPRPAD